MGLGPSNLQDRLLILASLEAKIRSLELEIDELKSAPRDKGQDSSLNKLLSDAIKARDTYQTDFFAAQRDNGKLRKEAEIVEQ